MKILAISDRPPRENIKSILSKNKVDLICTLGDLEEYDIADLASINDIPKLGVYGNHCTVGYLENLGILNMHLKVFEFNGFTFGGFEGSVRYKQDRYARMYAQEEASEMLKNFPRVDVMLVHCPPYGINDEPDSLAHQGFVGLLEYIQKHQPKYLLHGHTYPNSQNLVTKYGNTEIIYVFQDRLVDIM